MPVEKRLSSIFFSEAVLFDMDGTLTDSIAAVEAAWGKVADDLHLPRHEVIAATHGRRAIDNLAALKPHIKPDDMDAEVEAFECTILAYADAYSKCPTRPEISPPSPLVSSSDSDSSCPSPSPIIRSGSVLDSDPESPPSLTPDTTSPPSRCTTPPADFGNQPPSPSFIDAAFTRVKEPAVVKFDPIHLTHPESTLNSVNNIDDDIDPNEKINSCRIFSHANSALEMEGDAEDRSIRVLPGVHRIIQSIPQGRYAVATSGARTYAHGALTRVGIVPPPVTITASDPRLKHGKPHPEPFLLAARELGYPPEKCVVFEDSPAGIRAGVASGATVIAVATSHEKEKISNCGAHYVVDNMESVEVEWMADEKKLEFKVRQ